MDKLEEIKKNIDIDGREFWKYMIIDYILHEELEIDENLIENQLDNMIDSIMDDDVLWNNIDNTIQEVVENEIV